MTRGNVWDEYPSGGYCVLWLIVILLVVIAGLLIWISAQINDLHRVIIERD